MRTVSIILVVCCLAISTSALAVNMPGVDYSGYNQIEVPGQFCVRFTDNADLNGVARGFGMFRLGISSVDKIFDNYQAAEVRPLAPKDVGKSTPRSRIYLVRIPKGMNDEQFKTAMRANPYVAEIQNDILCRVEATPDDASYSQQWALYQASRIDIHAQEAWDVETGSQTKIVAIIDTGVNYKHPDLRNNIWVNPGEDLDGDGIVFDKTDFDNVDNDGNGYRDDVIGYDFFTGGSLPAWSGEDGSARDNDPNDFNGHGTHCSGIAAAVTNNGIYGAGVAGGWGSHVGEGGVRIMALRAGYSANDGGDEVGLVLMSAVVEAINYAVDNGADVISYSAGSSNVTGMTQALNAAMGAGIVFCAAAGNDNADLSDYFGVYNGILAVAATNRWDAKWSWGAGAGSNYGTWVEISAPGQDIYSTYSSHYTPSYATLTGTSMATPHVAGLAALLKSHFPTYTKTQIENLILDNADNIDAVNPSYVGLLGAGRINAWNCLQHAPAAPFTASPRMGPAPLTVNFDDQNATAIDRYWTFGDGQNSAEEDPVHTYNDPGLYDVSLEVTDPNGTTEKTKKYFIFASADTLYGDPETTVPVSVTHDSFPVPIYLKNTVPLTGFTLSFDWITETGTADLAFKAVSVEGTRSADFDTVFVRALAPTTGKVSIEFKAVDLNDPTTDELPPGDGAIANLWFTSSGSGTLVMDTITLVGYKFGVTSRYVDYLPGFELIHLKTGLRGDANDDAQINAGDPVYLINYVFKSGPAPSTVYNGDANGDDAVNVADAVYLINYIFKSGPPPPP
jgi:subtilisin family serine protease